MKSAQRSSSFALWSGVLLSLVGLALIGWVLASLNDLHACLSAVSPRFAGVTVTVVIVVLLAILVMGVRFLWIVGRSGKRPSPDAVVAADPGRAARQSIESAEKQIARITDEVARRALSEELNRAASDLSEQTYTIVVFGTVSAGKTSVINALLGRPAGATDPITGTTKEKEEHSYFIEGFDDGRLRLMDTPGLSEIGPGGAMREQHARDLAAQADLLLFVVDQDLRDIEFRPLEMLARLGKRSILVFNKRDLYAPTDLDAITMKLHDRMRGLVDSGSIVICAAAPSPVAVRQALGTVVESPPPDVGGLAERLSEILRHQGRTLLAENILLRAKRVSDKAREAIHAERAGRAQSIVHRFTWTTAGVMFVNPVPGLGALAAAAINYQMIGEIAKVFGVSIGIDNAKRMARELAQVLVKMGVVGVSMEILGKALKASMVGYVAGGAIEGVAGAYLTRLAGTAFIDYFAHDQDWGEGGMQGAIERKFDLRRRNEFALEFVREAARRVFTRKNEEAIIDEEPKR